MDNRFLKKFRFILIISGSVALMLGLLFTLQVLLKWPLYVLALQPRTLSAPQGIITMHFFHENLQHLFYNLVTLLGVLPLAIYFFPYQLFKRFLILICSTGLLLFIIGQPGTYHIGASGVIYGITSYVFTNSIQKKGREFGFLSLYMLFFYGSMLVGIFPLDPHVSWQGHLSGMLSGVALALFTKQPETVELIVPEPEKEDPDAAPFDWTGRG